MNKKAQAIALAVAIASAAYVVKLMAAEPVAPQHWEYVTIRWAGVENTHIIRPGGQVEFIGAELRKMPKPDKADNRSFFLNCAMNGLTKEGFEFAGISNDDIVMKRLTR
jgi:hypothetical protein